MQYKWRVEETLQNTKWQLLQQWLGLGLKLINFFQILAILKLSVSVHTSEESDLYFAGCTYYYYKLLQYLKKLLNEYKYTNH